MVGSCNHNGINVLLFGKHFAVILVFRYVWPFPEGISSGIFPIDIAQGHNVFGIHVRQVIESHSAHANSGNVKFIAGSFVTQSGNYLAWQNSYSSCCKGCCFQKMPTTKV